MFVLCPNDYFYSSLHEEDLQIASSSSNMICELSQTTFDNYVNALNIWKTKQLKIFKQDIKDHLNEIPENIEDMRFYMGFELQRKILNIALKYFENKDNKDKVP